MMENRIIKGGLYFCAENGWHVLSKENIKQDNSTSINYFNATSIDGMVDKYVDLICTISAFKLVEDPAIYDIYGLPFPSDKPQKDKLEQAKRIIKIKHTIVRHLRDKCERFICEKEELLKEIENLKMHNYVTYGCGGIAIIKGDHYVKVSECITAIEEKEKELKAEFYDTIKKTV